MPADPLIRARRVRLAVQGAGVLLVVFLILAFGYGVHLRERKVWLANASATSLLAAVARNPEDSEIAYTAAFRLWQNGEPEKALPLAERAAALSPARAVNQLLLGYLYAQDRRPV